MHICAHRRSAVVLILLVLFVPAVLRAAPSRGLEQPVAAARATGGILAFVQSVLSVFGGKNGPWQPSGAGPTGDNGSILDPNG